MTARKRTKTSRQHGSHTHGWGSMKKHRGAGNRGGSGKSGTGKRADSTKPSIWKDTEYFGRHGFSRAAYSRRDRAINVAQIELQIDALSSEKKVVLHEGAYAIDLAALGYDKLIGSGPVTKKLIITAKKASQKAIDKVAAAGGQVKVAEKKAVQKKAAPKKNTEQ